MSVFYEVTRPAPQSIDQNYSQQEVDRQSVKYLLSLLVESRHSWEVITPENRVAHQSVHNRYDMREILSWLSTLKTSLELLLVIDPTLPPDLQSRIHEYTNRLNPAEIRVKTRFDDSYFLEGNELIEAILRHYGVILEKVIDPKLKPDAEQTK